MDDYSPEIHTGFFPDFAAHGFFDALSGFQEASERAVPVFRPSLLAAEQDAFSVGADDGHDNGRVGAREAQVGDAGARCAGRAVAGVDLARDVFGRAGAFEASVDGERAVPAGGAEGVSRVPVQQVAGFGVDGGWI